MKTLVKPDPKAGQRPVEILLVEDNPGDVNLLSETFKNSRFAIHLSVVQDGEQALNFLRRKSPYSSALKPDLILLDLNLPRKNGHEVAAEIRRSRHFSDIPTLVLTSSDHDDDKWKAYQTRVSAYLLKPAEWSQYGVLLNYLEENWMKEIRLDLPPGFLTSGDV
jgi:chemotaxis family two-component system response regulator Rcp1